MTEYSLFTREELAKIEGDDAPGGIDIVEFVDPLAVDIAYFDKSYWVGPGGKSARGFDLLHVALEDTKKVALAKVKIRTRTRLAILRPREKLFALDMMRFADELVVPDQVTDDVIPSAARDHVELAKKVVKALTGEFDAKKYTPLAAPSKHAPLAANRASVARCIWTGEICFGLVCIPAKLYSATSDRDFDSRRKRVTTVEAAAAPVIDLAAERARRAVEAR